MSGSLSAASTRWPLTGRSPQLSGGARTAAGALGALGTDAGILLVPPPKPVDPPGCLVNGAGGGCGPLQLARAM